VCGQTVHDWCKRVCVFGDIFVQENTLIMELDAVDGDYAAQREIRYYIVNGK